MKYYNVYLADIMNNSQYHLALTEAQTTSLADAYLKGLARTTINGNNVSLQGRVTFIIYSITAKTLGSEQGEIERNLIKHINLEKSFEPIKTILLFFGNNVTDEFTGGAGFGGLKQNLPQLPPTSLTRIQNGKIFISHSAKDIGIVESFVQNILRLGLDIPAEHIFCSSMEGHGIKSGQYIPERLRKEMHSASLVLLFISRNFKASEVCLNELGAAWVTLEQERIVPVLMPDVDFEEIGFLNIGKLGIKIYEEVGLLKLIEDTKSFTGAEPKLNRLTKQVKEFLRHFQKTTDKPTVSSSPETPVEVNDWTDCFEKSLYPYNEVLRKTIPAYSDGIYQLTEISLQVKLLQYLSQTILLDHLWYRFSGGDDFVFSIKQLPSGHWSFGNVWELKVSDIWLFKTASIHNEFILLKTEALPPFKISSDVGGEAYDVGILDDGFIVSENERQNGYAIIGGKTIDLQERKVEYHYRRDEPHWVFLITGYHKLGYDANSTISFCEMLDKGEIQVTKENLRKFIFGLRSHPTVIKYN